MSTLRLRNEDKSKITVIIPTYNRGEKLLQCIKSFEKQSVGTNVFDVIIIDDGSDTETSLGDISSIMRTRIRYVKQEHRGPASARNNGIRNAESDILFFTGDDMIPAPDLIQRHIDSHKKFPDENYAILGLIKWNPEIRISPLMKWLDKGGPQFHYWKIKDRNEPSDLYFYSSNISVKRTFLLENGLFDEEFKYAAWEDIELGYRLASKGLKIIYNDKAICYHNHKFSLWDACMRMEKVGSSSLIFARKIGRGNVNREFLSNQVRYGLAMNLIRSPIMYGFIESIMNLLPNRESLFGKLLDWHYYRGKTSAVAT